MAKNIMQSLLAEFAPEPRKPADPALNQSACQRCGGIELWQPLGQSDAWYCVHCDPPPVQSMVAQTGAPTIKQAVSYVIGRKEKQTVSCGGNLVDFVAIRTRPVCECGSHMVTEHTWSDGLVTYECASCLAGIATAVVAEGN